MELNRLNKLRSEANKLVLKNFGNTTCFERAVFFSWACNLNRCCKYCYMSTLPKHKRTKERVRSIESLLAETLICREFGWDYGFLSGGLNVFSDKKLLEIIKKTSQVLNHKIWVNIGILTPRQLELFKPYIEGVIGTIEVLDPALHQEICPDKPMEPVMAMFDNSLKLGLKNGMTIIIGLGEKISDFRLLKEFIARYKIDKIHIYGLNPQKGTIFEDTPPPLKEQQGEWIALTRLAFPDIDIQAGIWLDRVNRVAYLLESGANSISKFPATSKFGTPEAREIELQARKAGRIFRGTLTKLPDIDWDMKISELPFDDELKAKIKYKLNLYLKKMAKNIACG